MEEIITQPGGLGSDACDDVEKCPNRCRDEAMSLPNKLFPSPANPNPDEPGIPVPRARGAVHSAPLCLIPPIHVLVTVHGETLSLIMIGVFHYETGVWKTLRR